MWLPRQGACSTAHGTFVVFVCFSSSKKYLSLLKIPFFFFFGSHSSLVLADLKYLPGVATQVKAISEMRIRSARVCRFNWLLGPVEGWRQLLNF